LVQGLVKALGPETVKLWTALLLKKRVVVYAPRLADLLKVMRTIPQLCWHRQDWDVLRPFVTGSQLEVAEFASAGVYVVGVTDPAFRTRPDLYDLYVDGTCSVVCGFLFFPTNLWYVGVATVRERQCIVAEAAKGVAFPCRRAGDEAHA
jgi:hypothetical protein